MRRSSRIGYFLGLAAFWVASSEAGGVHVGGSGIGGARGLSPIHPVVGGSRGLSPIRPVVGGERHLPSDAIDARRAIDSRERWFGQGLGGHGLDVTAGSLPGVPSGGDLVDQGGPEVGPYPILMAPPRPCVSPQIISIGRLARRSSEHVKVIYGTPGCGRF